MKITITDDDGTVLEVIEAEDIGDLSKPLAAADVLETIRRAQRNEARRDLERSERE
jgi:hypothetical protein